MIDLIKKTAILIYVLIALTSCTAGYNFFGDIMSGLDFRKGKWLLNRIHCPTHVKGELTDIAIDGFSDLLDNRLYTLDNTDGLIIPQNISTSPKKSTLKQINKTSEFDYLINIRTEVISNDCSSFYKLGKSYKTLTNKVAIYIEIYDLNNQELIYSLSSNAYDKIEKDIKGPHFITPTGTMTIKSLKKMMKKIKKHCIS